MALFRREAINARLEEQSGEVIISGPPSGTVLAALIMVFVLAILGFVRWGSFTRKQSVAGYLVPDRGLVRVYAPTRGSVLKRPVRQGQRVRKGQLLAVISTRRAAPGGTDVGNAMMHQVAAEIGALQQEINQACALAETRERRIRQQTQGLERQLVQLNIQIRTEVDRLGLMQRQKNRLSTLQRAGLVSAEVAEASVRDVLEAESGIDALKKSREEIRARISTEALSVHETRVTAAQDIARSQQEIHELRRRLAELQAQQGIEIRAPTTGTIATISVETGQAVSRSVPVITIIPEGSLLEARLLVPTDAIGFVVPGQPVLLRYAAFPYQHFGMYHGKIITVAHAAIDPAELQTPFKPPGPVYAVTVALNRQTVHAYGRSEALQAGMLLQADVIIDREPLYRWILDPLYSLKGTIGG